MLTDCFLLRSDETAAPAAVFPSAQASPANWRRLDYLARGNPRQRSAHALLSSGVWDTLGRLCQDEALVSLVTHGFKPEQVRQEGEWIAILAKRVPA